MKKGQLMDLPILMIFLFIIGVTLTIIFFIVDESASSFATAGLNSTFMQNARQSLVTLDNSMVILYVGLLIGLITSAFLIRSHPIFLVVGLFVIGFMIFLGAFLSNFWEDITLTSTFTGTMTSVPNTSLLLSNWPTIIFFGFIIIMIALVMKAPGGGSFT